MLRNMRLFQGSTDLILQYAVFSEINTVDRIQYAVFSGVGITYIKQ